MSTPTVAFKAGFSVKQTVPEAGPFVFVWLERGEVTLFPNDPAAVAPHVPLAMPLRTQFYGMREFAVDDPDGHLITFAELVAA